MITSGQFPEKTMSMKRETFDRNSERLTDHFAFKVNSEGNFKDGDQNEVFIHCNMQFTYTADPVSPPSCGLIADRN